MRVTRKNNRKPRGPLRMSEAEFAARQAQRLGHVETAADKEPVKNKWGNVKKVIGGIKFGSTKEAERYVELCWQVKGGTIRDLRLQVVYVLAPAVKLHGEKRKKPALRYIADFVYVLVATGETITEDAKGKATVDFRIKKHLMATVLGLFVREV